MNPSHDSSTSTIDPCRDWSAFHTSSSSSSSKSHQLNGQPSTLKAVVGSSHLSAPVDTLDDCVDPYRDWSQMHR